MEGKTWIHFDLDEQMLNFSCSHSQTTTEVLDVDDDDDDESAAYGLVVASVYGGAHDDGDGDDVGADVGVAGEDVRADGAVLMYASGDDVGVDGDCGCGDEHGHRYGEHDDENVFDVADDAGGHDEDHDYDCDGLHLHAVAEIGYLMVGSPWLLIEL